MRQCLVKFVYIVFEQGDVLLTLLSMEKRMAECNLNTTLLGFINIHVIFNKITTETLAQRKPIS